MVTGVSAQSRTAVFVRKYLDRVQCSGVDGSRDAFNETVFVSELSVCQWLPGQELRACVCLSVCLSHGCFLPV